MKVLAAVVTHNRRELLSRCLDHLSTQVGAPPEILVIDNACTDGTVEMLESRRIAYVTQENVGSAGGWHRAIEEAQNRGFDAVWLMDDDGYPDASALTTLVMALSPDVVCVSSVVLREDDPERFVFPFPRLDATGMPRIFALPRKYPTLSELRGRSMAGLYPFAHLFNGALLDLRAIGKIGNVNRDYFMFGDEVDFFFRMRQAGKVLSVLEAKHFHPDVTQRPYTPAKIYYYVKNTLILNRRYFNHAWLRSLMAVLAALARTTRRNGLATGLSYVFGRNARVLAAAVSRGLSGKIGKDFNG